MNLIEWSISIDDQKGHRLDKKLVFEGKKEDDSITKEELLSLFNSSDPIGVYIQKKIRNNFKITKNIIAKIRREEFRQNQDKYYGLKDPKLTMYLENIDSIKNWDVEIISIKISSSGIAFDSVISYKKHKISKQLSLVGYVYFKYV